MPEGGGGDVGGRGGDGGRYTPGGPGTTAGYLQGRPRARTANPGPEGRATQRNDELNALSARVVVHRLRDPAQRTGCNVMPPTLRYKSRRPAHSDQQIHYST